MNIKPLFDRIVVEEIKEEKSSSGIFLGSCDTDGPKNGIVLYTPECEENADGKKLKLYVKKGDKVIFNKYAGAEAIIDKKTLIFIRQTDILAVLE